jgi:hypothetical protein
MKILLVLFILSRIYSSLRYQESVLLRTNYSEWAMLMKLKWFKKNILLAFIIETNMTSSYIRQQIEVNDELILKLNLRPSIAMDMNKAACRWAATLVKVTRADATGKCLNFNCPMMNAVIFNTWCFSGNTLNNCVEPPTSWSGGHVGQAINYPKAA